MTRTGFCHVAFLLVIVVNAAVPSFAGGLTWYEELEALREADTELYEMLQSNQWPVRADGLRMVAARLIDDDTQIASCHFINTIGNMLEDSSAPVREAALSTLSAFDFGCASKPPYSYLRDGQYQTWPGALAKQVFLRRLDDVHGVFSVSGNGPWISTEERAVGERILGSLAEAQFDKTAAWVVDVARAWADAIGQMGEHADAPEICAHEISVLADAVSGPAWYRATPERNAVNAVRLLLFGSQTLGYRGMTVFDDALMVCSRAPTVDWVRSARAVFDAMPFPYDRDHRVVHVGDVPYMYSWGDIDPDATCERRRLTAHRRGDTPLSYAFTEIEMHASFNGIGDLLRAMASAAHEARVAHWCEDASPEDAAQVFGWALEAFLASPSRFHWSESGDYVLRLFSDILLDGTDGVQSLALRGVRVLGPLAEPIRGAVAYVAERGQSEPVRREAAEVLGSMR